MITLNEQISLFKAIGNQLNKKIDCFVIGGSAMLFYELKQTTKDIDIVLTEDDDRKLLVRVLREMGFESRSETIFKYIEIAKNKPILMERRDGRLDLFCNEIISTKLSPGIIDRVTQKHEFSNLVANIISPEDIILLKCATERAGDRADAAAIIKSREIDWDTVINESIWQTTHGKRIFTIFLFDFMMELREDYKVDIPLTAIKRVTKIYEEEMMKHIKKYNK